jgi:hypothetical protein
MLQSAQGAAQHVAAHDALLLQPSAHLLEVCTSRAAAQLYPAHVYNVVSFCGDTQQVDAHSDVWLASHSAWLAAGLLFIPTVAHENAVHAVSTDRLSRGGALQHCVLQSAWL